MLLIDKHGIAQRADFLCGLNRVFRQIRLGRNILQRIDPRPSVFGASGILRNRNDFKILVFQLLVDCLPAWQVKAAPSPTGPRDEQDLLSAKVREPVRLALQIGQCEVRRLQ